MPVDQDGNRADIVMDPNSTVSRMNIGRLYEQYINSASRDVVKKITKDLNIVTGEKGLKNKLIKLETSNDGLFNKSWEYLLGYYQIVSPTMHNWFIGGEYKGTRADHLTDIINRGIYLFMPPDNEAESTDIIRTLEKHYRPTYGPITYTGSSGKKVTTKNPVRIGSMYTILLEKTGDDWTAVSSGKLQAFGVLSQVTNTDKFSQPSRNQAIRALGESEVRIYAAYCGGKITADILDRNNNPDTHKAVLESILEADIPTNIDNAVDRTKLPIGMSKPLLLVKHTAQVAGYKFVYKKHIPEYGPIINPDWNKPK